MTELADGSALAQRFGRVNRLGHRPESRIEVVGPELVDADQRPYCEEDLIAAQHWVRRREHSGGVSPAALLSDPAPQPSLPRLVLSDLTSGHASYLATTSTPLFAEPDGAQQARRRANASELPVGWRHEQLSAAITWAQAELFPDPELVTRLVGTSHGRGRPFFPHAARPAGSGLTQGRLLAEDGVAQPVREAAHELFATGAGWDDILARTAQTYGPWGCAYLEALLRAADCTISKEGS